MLAFSSWSYSEKVKKRKVSLLNWLYSSQVASISSISSSSGSLQTIIQSKIIIFLSFLLGYVSSLVFLMGKFPFFHALFKWFSRKNKFIQKTSNFHFIFTWIFLLKPKFSFKFSRFSFSNFLLNFPGFNFQISFFYFSHFSSNFKFSFLFLALFLKFQIFTHRATKIQTRLTTTTAQRLLTEWHEQRWWWWKKIQI